MTKKSIKLEFKNFIKGLVTEASAINFPAEASADEENFKLNRDGSRDRRYGLGYENGAVWRPLGITFEELPATNPVTFEWNNVNGYSGTNFLVIQSGKTLLFYDLNIDPISTTGYKGEIYLPEIGSRTQVSMAGVSGNLVVVSNIASIYIVKYDGTTFTASLQKLLVRDLWGIEEESGLEGDDKLRPSGLSMAHMYNLNNQSWGIPRKDATGMLRDPVPIYKSASGPTAGGVVAIVAPVTHPSSPTNYSTGGPASVEIGID